MTIVFVSQAPAPGATGVNPNAWTTLRLRTTAPGAVLQPFQAGANGLHIYVFDPAVPGSDLVFEGLLTAEAIAAGYEFEMELTNGSRNGMFRWRKVGGYDANSDYANGAGVGAATGIYYGAFNLFDSDGTQYSASTDFLFSTGGVVNLAITTTAAPDGTVDGGYYLPVVAVGGSEIYSLWEISVGALPAGLAIDPDTGVIYGTITDVAGDYTFTVRVTDSDGNIDTQAFTLTVNEQRAGTVIDIDTEAPAAAELNEAYTETITVSGATAPVEWEVILGSLPPGLTLDAATGVISGTPTQGGTYPFTLQVTDADSNTDTEEFSIVVEGCVPRAVAETVAVLIERVRRELGDPITDPSGNTITDPTHSNDDIRQSLNDTMVKIGRKLRSNHRGEALQAVDFEYSESANRRGCDLPAGVLASAIFQVEDIVSAAVVNPRPLQYVDLAEIAEYDRPVDGMTQQANLYTLVVEGEAYRIIVRPEPAAGRYLRIWYAATPLVTCADSESIPIAAEWAELIGLDAALRLLRYSGEETASTKLACDEQWEQFNQQSKRNKGHQRVRTVARGIY